MTAPATAARRGCAERPARDASRLARCGGGGHALGRCGHAADLVTRSWARGDAEVVAEHREAEGDPFEVAVARERRLPSVGPRSRDGREVRGGHALALALVAQSVSRATSQLAHGVTHVETQVARQARGGGLSGRVLAQGIADDGVRERVSGHG